MNKRMQVILKFGACLILLLTAYLPTLAWMADRWRGAESYYGHGFLIPVISLFLVWQRRERLKRIAVSSEISGLWLVVFGIFAHVVCAALKVYFISGFSFVFVLYGLVLFFFGREIARGLIFPVFFLMAMVPLPLTLIGAITVKMKLFAAEMSTVILNNIGFPSIRDGSVIRMPHSFIAVEAPCSGLRSLIALMTLGLLFSYTLNASYPRKAVLFSLSVPIALLSNILRIITIAVVNDLYGGKAAMGLFHDVTGFLVFGAAFAGLLSASQILER